MKKIFLLFTLILSLFAFSACKKNANYNPELPTIGIAKLINHNSLNDAEKGVIDELNAQGVKVNIIQLDANGDLGNTSAIANKFKADKVDVAVGIATPMTASLFNVLDNTPIVFTAVTDPVMGGFATSMTQGKKNVTGVVDAIPIKEQLEEFKKFYDYKRVGVIYTSSEANSISMVETTKKACEELGIELVLQSITTPADLKQATESMVDRVDAFYCFTDNSIATALPALTETAAQKKIPVFAGDITPTLNGGVVYALGFSYYEMGRMTGKQVIEILNGKKAEELPILSLKDEKYYNKLFDLDAAENLGITVSNELQDSAKYLIKNKTLISK